MLKTLRTDLAAQIRAALVELWQLEHDPVIEVPPRRELGDLASPTPLHLAKALKRAPRDIAADLLGALEAGSSALGVARITVEGPGYLNFFLERAPLAKQLLEVDLVRPAGEGLPKVVIEHTNINPNKAAHIGHLRNAVLGDVLVRCHRALGYETEVQNYIDDTGVQVADVVVGFIDVRGMTVPDVEALPEPFDYTCWDLYSEVGRWYDEDPARQSLRRETLHELEAGEGPRWQMGTLVARRIVGRHLATMARLDIHYDLLTHESEILHLDFFQAAFERLKLSGAIRLEASGKNEGCWVMPLSDSEEFQGLEDPDKVIVRSDGTVTYVGKDIAYQTWKFGLLGRDFAYRPYPESGHEDLWETLSPGVDTHPSFGRAERVINVIDARQSYLQKIVRAGLAALGHAQQAEHSIHFAYEMVSLSKSTARKLGYLDDSSEDEGKSLEMSGRKGIGVKADDLLDQLLTTSKSEIETRNAEREDALGPREIERLAQQIAVAALRYFMTKATTTRIIAFDLDEALSFEGDSGPYLQYSLVRAQNIFRKLAEEGIADTVAPVELDGTEEHWSDDLWDLVLSVGQIGLTVERAAATLELSVVARHAVELAQKFHAVYHRHPILHEEDLALRTTRLAATRIFQRGLLSLVDLLGVPAPERM